MRIQDLMVGDWFKTTYPNGMVEYRKVTSIYENGYVGCRACVTNAIEPIPLTPEILEKNGFKKKEEGETYSEYVSVWEEISIISFAFYKETICGVDTLLECELGFSGGLDRIHHCHIKYVHQLQHALRLCGIEKEIEL